MRKRISLVALAGLLLVGLPASALAAENIIKFFERNGDRFMTQGEWAVTLVTAMGQQGELESGSSQIDFIAMLEKNRIQPIEGWNHGEFLHFGAKAVTMTQALGLEEQLPPDATELDYIWLLESLGFHEGHPTELVRDNDALQRNINDPIFQEVAGNEYNINITPFAPRTGR